MPPKRRRVPSETDAPGPTKRITRSSLKTKASQQESQRPVPTKPTPHKTRTERDCTKEIGFVKKAPKDGSSQNVNGPMTFTIESQFSKKPITYHQYNSRSKFTSDDPTLIFTHGAGGTLDAPAVVNFCTGYSCTAPVLAFQGSMNLKARTKSFHAFLPYAKSKVTGGKLVLGGRSMGARAAVIAGTEILASSRSKMLDLHLILVSYPLKGPKDDIRDQILVDLPSSAHVLFVVGNKDTMCPLDLLNTSRKKMVAKSQIVIVNGADHGMHVKPAETEKRLGEETGSLAAAWVAGKVDEEEVVFE